MLDIIQFIASMPPALAAVVTVVYVHVLMAKIARRQSSIAGQVQAIAKYMGVEIASGAHVIEAKNKVKRASIFLMMVGAAVTVGGCAMTSRTQGYIGDNYVDLQTNGTTGPDAQTVGTVAKAAGVGLANGVGLGPMVAAAGGIATAAAGVAGLLSERSRRKYHEKDADEAWQKLTPTMGEKREA